MSNKPLEQSDFNLLFVFIIVPVAFLLYHLFFRSVDFGLGLLKHPIAAKVIWIFSITLFLGLVFWVFARWNSFIETTVETVKKFDKAIYLGRSQDKEELYLTTDVRTRHTQVIGTTSSGKSESVILPWAIQDIQNRGGLIIIDGKADKSFLDKIYAYAVAAGRASDFRLFSLSNPKQSCSFNPLAVGTVQEVTERVFSSFQFDNEYFESVQFRIFRDVIALIKEQDVVPTFAHLQHLLTSKETLAKWIEARQNDGTKRVSVLIGGANGHSEEVRAAADEVWNLSAMTLQHELALVVFMEQLYRAYSIVRGEPYHRE